jgi:hypothetical protein
LLDVLPGGGSIEVASHALDGRRGGIGSIRTTGEVVLVVGARVEILGQGFEDGVTQVYFNGVAGEDLDIQPTYIKATVPQGATTGPIAVTTGAITLKSNKPFVIH